MKRHAQNERRHEAVFGVVAENLFVEVAKQMEWLDADIGALQLALEQAPEVFESVGVNLSVNVLSRHGQSLRARNLVA